jgi:hypothetical protein
MDCAKFVPLVTMFAIIQGAPMVPTTGHKQTTDSVANPRINSPREALIDGG